ncbi:hypothetical protein NA57DRAFT_45984 [Rhizodiscina lignyota]|uniref:Transcriptional regulatory protein RXT2 N-terminal domain-containing protein n=1 Tax=Rhizodiscina lignyota TaxID=1504668 RepID=A0A9P4M2P1_9PEZI|nr:hypothetical protein NA57DRAFT_45984 [Rhizodiscina lignyota]
MAAAQARIVDTIVEMKRTLARLNDDSDGEDPIDRPTNRGNKLRHDARYVQEGRLNIGTGPSVYSRKINHAGYERNIIYRNPPRYDEDGDLILEDDNDDVEAEISPAEDNIYGDIKIEEILAPLTTASDLPNHIGMAPAYKSKAIDQMIIDVSDTLRREQKNLLKLKRLLTTLRGDPAFAPCGVMHTEFDDLNPKSGNGSSENLVGAQEAGDAMHPAAGRHTDTEMADGAGITLTNGTEQAIDIQAGQNGEEIVRGVEELHNGLLLANRKRKNVLKWAKAEGHVGEMSDGEDWYDIEEWGLEVPLKKGEEEQEEEANTVGKKTRQRRAER